MDLALIGYVMTFSSGSARLGLTNFSACKGVPLYLCIQLYL